MTSLRVDCPWIAQRKTRECAAKIDIGTAGATSLLTRGPPRGEHGGLAALHDMLGATHGRRWIEGQNAAGGEPIEHHPDGREVLFDGRGGVAIAEVLDIGRDVDRADGGNRGHAVSLQPSAEP